MALGIWETLIVSVVSGAIGGYGTYRNQERKLQKEYQLHDSAEHVARTLLSDVTWRLRSFKVIRHHLGGFEDNELQDSRSLWSYSVHVQKWTGALGPC
jgi:hypothetical protein